MPAGLLAHLAEFQGRLRDPARIRDVAGCLQGQRLRRDRLVPVRLDPHEAGQRMDEVGALALPLVPGGVLGGLQDVAPLGLQPGRRLVLRGQGRDRDRRAGDRDRHPAPERVKFPVGQVGGVQVVVEEPPDRLPPHGRWLVPLGAHGRVAADEVMEHNWPPGAAGQQVMVKQGADASSASASETPPRAAAACGLICVGRAHPQPTEELLMARLQGTVGQLKGGHPVKGRHAPRPRRGQAGGTVPPPGRGAAADSPGPAGPR